ncbi:hypothetical protein FF1_045382 [Malus domestica]
MREEDLAITDVNGCTPLVYAIYQNSIGIVEKMIEKNKNIATMRTSAPNARNPVLNNRTPVLHAASLDLNEIARKLYTVTPLDELTRGPNEGRDLIYVKPTAAETSTPTNDLRLNVENPQDDQGDQTGLNVENPQDDQGDQPGLIHSGVNHIYEMKSVHLRTREFLRFMGEHFTYDTPKQYMFLQTAIFRAVEQGQVDFIYHLFKVYPGFEIQDGKGKTVLPYAVECRQAKIFNLLLRMLKESGRTLILIPDTFNNSILHSAANLSANLNHIQGAALQMQSELQLFKEVESILPVMASELMNNTDRMTARELFTKNHKELVKEGEKSMKVTATSCTVVGALIVTMMFAVAFTIPGGNTQDKGYLTFLGMLTSRYSEDDFLKSLPRKMIFGLFTLFFSIAAMMIAFSSALMLDKQSWIVFPIILLATLPIASFVWMQFPLLVDTCISTYGPGKFDKRIR